LNAELRKEKAARAAQFRETLGTIAVNPVTLLVGGFVVTNVLQHTTMARAVEVNKAVNPLTWWPWNSASTTTTEDLSWLSDDQANILRLAMVMLASSQSGLITALGGAVGNIVKAAVVA
jgi:hypothetical protein